jgi:hypothetical protein
VVILPASRTRPLIVKGPAARPAYALPLVVAVVKLMATNADARSVG